MREGVEGVVEGVEGVEEGVEGEIRQLTRVRLTFRQWELDEIGENGFGSIIGCTLGELDQAEREGDQRQGCADLAEGAALLLGGQGILILGEVGNGALC